MSFLYIKGAKDKNGSNISWRYENAKVICLKNNTGDLWVSMKDVGVGLGVKSISDLVLKEIHGICEKKN